MKVLFIASELNPLVKTGGLADVVSGLPKALKAQGIEVRIALPDYPALNNHGLAYQHKPTFFQLGTATQRVECLVSEVLLPGADIPVYLFKNSQGLKVESIYPSLEEGDQDRFTLFSLAVVEWLKTSSWQPDVIHCHDWMTGAIPSLLQRKRLPIPTLLTIHNLMYQGVIKKAHLQEIGLPASGLASNVNLLMMGIRSATMVNTVSPTYAREVTTHEYGWGLETVINRRAKDFSGILNGIDYEVFSPENDSYLPHSYNMASVKEGKAVNKAQVQRRLGLHVSDDMPMFGMVTRLEDQKGLELVESALRSTPLLKHAQFVVLGKGDTYWERRFQNLAESQPSSMAVTIKYDEELARQIYAGSDFFLVPSKFEPCGLTQLIAMRYGAIPIVRRTGGLADTVIDLSAAPTTGTGIVFDGYTAIDFSKALGRSMGLYQASDLMEEVVQRAMKQDFSWAPSALAYRQLYAEMKSRQP